jgi:hypothetical protein
MTKDDNYSHLIAPNLRTTGRYGCVWTEYIPHRIRKPGSMPSPVGALCSVSPPQSIILVRNFHGGGSCWTATANRNIFFGTHDVWNDRFCFIGGPAHRMRQEGRRMKSGYFMGTARDKARGSLKHRRLPNGWNQSNFQRDTSMCSAVDPVRCNKPLSFGVPFQDGLNIAMWRHRRRWTRRSLPGVPARCVHNAWVGNEMMPLGAKRGCNRHVAA